MAKNPGFGFPASPSVLGLERPVGTSNGNNAVWHWYVHYNLAMMGFYLRFSVSKTSIRRTCGAQSH